MSRFRHVTWLLAGLTAVSLLISSQLYVAYRAEGVPIPFGIILALQVGHWTCWAAAGPLAWSLAARWPLRPGRRLQSIARHAAAAVIVAIAIIVAFGALSQLAMRVPWTARWLPMQDRSIASTARFLFTTYFHLELLVYAAIVAVAHAVHSYRALVARERESLQLASQLANARLHVLTAQLQPHFLFNALHTVGSLILQRKNDDALRILAELGDLLRITLDRQNAGSITLREEIEHLERYLRIEEARFGDRLTVRWRVDPLALDARIAPLILQPLVENAIKHGVAASVDPVTVDLHATRNAHGLCVSIYNDGPLLPRDWAGETSFGFGLRNLHERLVTLGRGRLSIANEGTHGVRATLEIGHA
jgi:two-component system, LytTR family, sensor kinase